MDRYTGESTHTHHHGLLAGLGAGAAAVLGGLLLLLLVWHRIGSQVSIAALVLVWAFVAYAVLYLFLRLRLHLARPETLTRHTVRAEIVPSSLPAEVPAPAPLAALPAPVVHNWNLNDPYTAAAAYRAVADSTTEGNRP